MQNNQNELINIILNTKESENFELKKSENSFPNDALISISAFANTDGGTLVLGVLEKDTLPHELTGVKNPQKVIDDMFKLLNNKNKFNRNIIENKDIKIITQPITQKNIIIINVKKEDYKNKPIYLNSNPYNSYYRFKTGDYLCDKDSVDSMIRDANKISYDSTILSDFSIDDLDPITISKYRNKFDSHNSEHPFSKYDDEKFLTMINALKVNRSTNKICPTVAGLLMFGKHISIKESLPHYNVEYINKTNTKNNISFSDRVIYDGFWGEDNLFNFYFTVIEKLYSTLKNTSTIGDDSMTRTSTAKLRIAFREALVNSIIHSDYKNRQGVLIIRYANRVIFSNGGSLRISKEDYYSGGHSDPRNYYIQEMFRFIGICEKAGTGIPKILDAIKEQKYKLPNISSRIDSFELTLWDTTLIDFLNITNITEQKILELIIEKRHVAREDLDKYLGIHRNTTLKYLNNLLEKNIIEKVSLGRKYYYCITESEEFEKYNFVNALYSMAEEIRRK